MTTKAEVDPDAIGNALALGLVFDLESDGLSDLNDVGSEDAGGDCFSSSVVLVVVVAVVIVAVVVVCTIAPAAIIQATIFQNPLSFQTRILAQPQKLTLHLGRHMGSIGIPMFQPLHYSFHLRIGRLRCPGGDWRTLLFRCLIYLGEEAHG